MKEGLGAGWGERGLYDNPYHSFEVLPGMEPSAKSGFASPRKISPFSSQLHEGARGYLKECPNDRMSNK